MNKHTLQIPVYFRVFLETLFLVIAIFFFLSADFVSSYNYGAMGVYDNDHWLMCTLLEYHITLILGINPGGLWEWISFFPFHKVSVLFNDPTWGISLAMVPLWLIKRNIFLLVSIMLVLALILNWVATYWFAKKLGCKRVYAFFAALTFCLSGVASLIKEWEFWPFFLIPVLGCIIIKIFQSDKFIWPVLFGLGFGYLAWSSLHLFIMGGLFLLVFTIWKLWENVFDKKKIVLIISAFFVAALLASALCVPMYLVHSEFSRPSVPGEQFVYATNFANLIYAPDYHPSNPFGSLPFWNNLEKYAKGEVPIGISIAMFVLSIYLFVRFLSPPVPLKHKINFFPETKTIFYYCFPIILAAVNIFVFKRVVSNGAVDIFNTVLSYFMCGALIVFFRHKLSAALRNLPFLFFVLAIISAFLAFGPYYMIGENKAIPSPFISVLFFVPGFSGIRAVARWGILLSFGLSLGVFLSLSNLKTNIRTKIFINLLICLSFLELFQGIPGYPKPFMEPYHWEPRQVDIFLKPLPYGAVLELESYPISASGFKNLGYELYSSLYHKKPVVTGNSALFPQVTLKYLYDQGRGKLDCVRITEIRKFGARYWVFHMDKWPKEDNFNPGEYLCGLKRIAMLDYGETLVYEDPDPRIAVTPFELVK